jgi:hypothetical protein
LICLSSFVAKEAWGCAKVIHKKEEKREKKELRKN